MVINLIILLVLLSNSNLNNNTMEMSQQEDVKHEILALTKTQSDKLNRYLKSTDTTDLIMNYYSKQLINKRSSGFRIQVQPDRRLA